MEYIETDITITPFSENAAEIVMAMIDDLGYESYLIEAPLLKAFIRKDIFSEPNLKTVLSMFGPGGETAVSYSLTLIPEKNWNAIWEASFDPVVIDGKCTIKASFHKGLPKTKYTITIDPEMAFGTGHHQTTVLMVRAMLGLEREIRGRQVLDMGCGTGILTVLAAKMKASVPVHAVDNDQTAVRSATENARKNRAGGMVKVLCGDASLIQRGRYDIIMANINRNVITEDMPDYARGLRSGGLLITSGFYDDDRGTVEKAASDCGMETERTDSLDGWAGIVFRKRG